MPYRVRVDNGKGRNITGNIWVSDWNSKIMNGKEVKLCFLKFFKNLFNFMSMDVCLHVVGYVQEQSTLINCGAVSPVPKLHFLN